MCLQGKSSSLMLPMDRIRIKLEMQVLGRVSRAQTQRKVFA